MTARALTPKEYKQHLVQQTLASVIKAAKDNKEATVHVHTMDDFVMVTQLLLELSLDFPEADNVGIELHTIN